MVPFGSYPASNTPLVKEHPLNCKGLHIMNEAIEAIVIN